MSNKSTLTNKKFNWSYLIMFISLFVLGWIFPYTGDDWAWGSQIGLDRLSTWFDNYSGRYFGNLMVLALTRSNLLKAFAVSVGVGGTVCMVNKITGDNKYGIPIILCALVFMPSSLIRQSIAWTSGFANYTTSIFFTLIYITYVNGMYGRKPKSNILHAIFFAILGFGNTLIVEHVTLYNIILAIYVIAFVIIKYKKVCIQHIAYLFGCIFGTVLMFSNECYSSTLEGSDGYRTTALGNGISGIISRAFTNLFDVILIEGMFKNVVVLLIIAVVCALVWMQLNNEIKKKYRFLNTLSVLVVIAYTTFALYLALSGISKDSMVLLVMFASTVAYALSLVVFVFTLPIEKEKKAKLMFLLGSIFMLFAPLFAITPIGSRCFFAHYILFIAFALELCTLLKDSYVNVLEKAKPIMYSATCIGFACLFSIYAIVYVANEERVETAINDAQTSQQIVVEELPYQSYVWCSSLSGNVWEQRFKLFNGIDENVEITMADYENEDSLFDKIVNKLKDFGA